MQRAIALAQEAGRRGEVPIGALIVKETNAIGEGYNLRESTPSALAHAEILAIEKACAAQKSWRLLDCTLYVTCEPCLMCMGAILQARIPRLVFGCFDPKAGACGSIADFSNDPRLNHRVVVVRGVLAEDCGRLLSDFFKCRR